VQLLGDLNRCAFSTIFIGKRKLGVGGASCENFTHRSDCVCARDICCDNCFCSFVRRDLQGSRRADTPMPVRESEAIVLRTYPLGEGNLLVSFLSRIHGRLRGVANGARKPKSRFGATLEPLSHVRIWFYERETRDLVRISQVDLIESFIDAQREYSNSLALALASEVTEAVLGEKEVAEPNFRLLLLTARAVQSGTKLSLVLAYFALWIVRLGGWLPRLERCTRCGAELSSGAYATEGQGLVCAGCRLPGQRALSKEFLRIARLMLREKLEVVANEPIGSSALAEVKDYMLDVVEQHIERRLQSRRLLEESLEPLH
jgi:DNA repair protein RecO (recombination protein O)